MIQQAKSDKAGEIIRNSGSFFEQYSVDYKAQLRKALEQLKIDWDVDKGPACTQFSWGMKLGDASINPGERLEFLADGEEKNLIMWVKNDCESGDLSQFTAYITSNNGAFDEREFAFGRIRPGEQREWPLKIKIPKSMASRDDLVDVKFFQGDDARLANKPLDQTGQFMATIVQRERPRFAYTYWIDDIGRGNSDGRLSRG